MNSLRLQLRSPAGLLLDQPVLAVSAEDLDGWVGIRPGRADLVLAMPPGLLVFRDENGETFAALDGGLLEVRKDVCRVLARDVVLSRQLEGISTELEARLASRQSRARARRGAVDDLLREALARLASEVRP